MNVCLTMLDQFDTLAPHSLSFRGRTYTWNQSSPDHPVLVNGDRAEIVVSFVAPKQPSESIPSRIAVHVRYIFGLDLYEVRAVAYDGTSLAREDLFAISGVYVEDLRSVQVWTSRSEEDEIEGGEA